MNYFNGLLNNLSNGYTSVMIGFLIGYIIGVAKLGRNSVMLGLLVGFLFAVICGLVNSFIETVLPNNVTISVNVKFIFTLLLIFLFFFVVSSTHHMDRIMAQLSDFR